MFFFVSFFVKLKLGVGLMGSLQISFHWISAMLVYQYPYIS